VGYFFRFFNFCIKNNWNNYFSSPEKLWGHYSENPPLCQHSVFLPIILKTACLGEVPMQFIGTKTGVFCVALRSPALRGISSLNEKGLAVERKPSKISVNQRQKIMIFFLISVILNSNFSLLNSKTLCVLRDLCGKDL
jgi:hypothetical protein